MLKKYASASGVDIHFDRPLSAIAISAFDDGSDGLIADMVFPAVQVDKQSDKYYTIEKSDFLRSVGDDARRAPKTKANRIHFSVSSDSFFADNYALADEIPLEDIINADNPVRLRENSTRLVTGVLRREQEIRVANKVSSISNMGSGVILSGTSLWSDFVNSDPIADVTTGHAFIRQNTGLVANTAIIDTDTLKIVRRHPRLLDMYKYTSGGMLNDEQLRAIFSVEKIMEGSGIKENALEGATSSITNIWGNNVILARVAPGSVGLQTQTLGLRFNWRQNLFPGNFGVQRAVEGGAGQSKVEIIEVGHFQDEKIVASALGYVISTTL